MAPADPVASTCLREVELPRGDISDATYNSRHRYSCGGRWRGASNCKLITNVIEL